MNRQFYLQGEIDVAGVMAEQERRAAWQARAQRNSEWYALKQFWRADRLVRGAVTPDARQEAIRQRAQVVSLYRVELTRAWPKWSKAQEELRERRRVYGSRLGTSGYATTGAPHAIE